MEGPVVVLIHGKSSSKGTFAEFMKCENEKWPMYAVDLPGHGELSGKWREGEEYLVDVLEHVDLFVQKVSNGRQVVLLGHSMGARVCFEYLKKYPKRAKALIVEDMDTSKHFEEKRKEVEFKELVPKRSDALDFVKRCGYSESWFEHKEKQGMFHETADGEFFVGTNPHATCTAHNAFLASNGRVPFDELCQKDETLPILLLCAHKGSAVDKGELEWMKKTMENGKRKWSSVLITDSDHSIHRSQREKFTEEVAKFLAEC